MSSADDTTALINAWAKDPVSFAREALGMELASWQLDFLSSLVDQKRVTIRAGRGVGKSAGVSAAILWALLCFTPVKVIVTAPKADQAADVIWSEVEILRQRLPGPLAESVIVQKDEIYIKGLQRINFATIRTARADNPDALRGAHSEHIFIFCEESSGIADAAFLVLMGTMTTPFARMVLVGNMSRTSGFFHDTHFADRENLWRKIHVNAEKVALEGHRWYCDDFINAMRSKYGRDSDPYRVEVLGERPETEEGSVIPRYLVEAAQYRTVTPLPGYQVVWGLDVGRDRDRSSLAKRRGNVMIEPVKWWRISDATLLHDVIVAEYERVQEHDPENVPHRIFVDSIGMGGPVLDMLRRSGLPVTGVNVGEQHSSKDRYLRKRDELWFRGKDWFAALNSSIPSPCVVCGKTGKTDDDFISEISSVRWKETDTGKQKVESKQDMRSEGRESCDLSDAFILTFAGGSVRLPETSSSDRYKSPWQKRNRGVAPSWRSV